MPGTKRSGSQNEASQRLKGNAEVGEGTQEPGREKAKLNRKPRGANGEKRNGGRKIDFKKSTFGCECEI